MPCSILMDGFIAKFRARFGNIGASERNIAWLGPQPFDYGLLPRACSSKWIRWVSFHGL